MNQARIFRVVLKTPEGSRAIDCPEDEFLWNAAARCGIALPAICHQGRCLTCAARLESGEVDQSASTAYFAEDRAAGFILPCTGQPRSDIVLTTHRQWAMRRHRLALGLPAPYS